MANELNIPSEETLIRIAEATENLSPDSKIGNLQDLITDTKTNTVGAINEVKQQSNDIVEQLLEYEEGVWTPNLSGQQTYSTQEGVYTRVGNLVTVQCYLTSNNIVGLTTSQVSLGGLPFRSRVMSSMTIGGMRGVAITGSMKSLYAYIGEGTNYIAFRFEGDGSSVETVLRGGNFSEEGFVVRLAGSYTI